ncbi:MAG: glycoside hydrolase family 13 protein [Clostridia bacterium]|nr:glycoside hydrolase family 13 protein [Clostridia bacterium]
MSLEQARVIYNSRDIKFKRPQGACESGTEITYKLKILESSYPRDVDLIVVFDKTGGGTCYRMEPCKLSRGTDGYVTFKVTVPIYDTGLYWYWFEYTTDQGRLKVRKSGADNRAVIAGDHLPPWQQTIYKRKYDVPEFVKGGVYYHIFVDRFCHTGNYIEMPGKVTRHDWGGTPFYKPDQFGRIWNNDFFGGNLQGIIKKLPYLEQLGVTCLYLSPIFEAFSNHKYDTSNYFKIDPMFGTLDDFHELCEKAGEKDIRIILDGVFSHTGSDSLYFDKEGKYKNGAYKNYYSPYRDWYYFHDNESYQTWWGIDTLPRVNKESKSYIDFICGENGVARYWLRQGASGWRLDVVDELPNSFIEKLVEACKKEKSDCLIIGEVWEDASNKTAYSERKNYFEGDKLDTVMNYPLKNSLIDFILNGNAAGIKNTVESILENYPMDAVNTLMNNIGTHDTARILTALGDRHLGFDLSKDFQATDRMSGNELQHAVGRLKVASALQFTLPGVPCIYYGDEAGMQGYADPFNRRCFPWGNENEELEDWYRWLTEFRKRHSVYRDGSYRTLFADKGTYMFLRWNEFEQIITVANCGMIEEKINIPGIWEDVIGGETYSETMTVFPGALMLLVEKKN